MGRFTVERHLEFGLIRQADKIRVVLVFFLAAVCLAAGDTVLTLPSTAMAALAMAALVCVWSLFLLRWDVLLLGGRLPLVVALFILFDTGWMTLFVIASGGFASPFWPLLLLVVIFTGAFFSDASWTLPCTALLVGCIYVGLAGGAAGRNLGMVWELSGRLLVVMCIAWFTWGLASVLERERQANQRIVRHLTEGVMLVNSEGIVLMANPQLGEMCGLGVGDLVGRSIRELSATRGYAVVRQLLADMLEAPRHLVTSQLVIEGKQTRDLRCSTVPCGGGERPLGWVLIVQDVTDLLARTRLHEQGLGLVSHELRSPLASLRAMAQLLSGISGDLSEAERERVATTIDREADRLSRLVAGLLDLAKLEQPDFALHEEEVNLRDLADRVAELFELTAEAAKVELRVEMPENLPTVRGDADRLAQILNNLVDNALKHTPPGGTVTIGGEARQEQVRVWVRDTGSGIAPEAMPLIFLKFGQAPGTEKGSARGVGLGLYVSRLLALKHGGDLQVSSQVGKGSTFVLVLPRGAAASTATGREADAAAGGDEAEAEEARVAA